MMIGYARVSTNEQNLDLQLDALKKEGVTDPDIYTDKITGTKADRPGLENALSHLREGDTLVVWRLDRLARSLSNLIELVNKLAGQGIAFKGSVAKFRRRHVSQLPLFLLFLALKVQS
jgi:DNA invertase Pin-like site-specific DNA recombinase